MYYHENAYICHRPEHYLGYMQAMSGVCHRGQELSICFLAPSPKQADAVTCITAIDPRHKWCSGMHKDTACYSRGN